jgi:hypothetical protein
MADLQVTCINKQPRNDTHEGHQPSRRRRLELDPAAGDRFDQKRLEHFLHARRRQAAEVAVVNGPTANTCARTPTVLLALQECA